MVNSSFFFTLCDGFYLCISVVSKEVVGGCLQKRNTLLVCCVEGQVLEIEGPEPDAHDPVHTYEITTLRTRTHQFKSVKSSLLVCPHFLSLLMPSVLWHCWLDVRKSILPVKIVWWGVGVVICLLSEVQIVCIWSGWCHYHPTTPSSLASFKSRLVLPFWYQLTQVVLEKRPLNGCISSSSGGGGSSSCYCSNEIRISCHCFSPVSQHIDKWKLTVVSPTESAKNWAFDCFSLFLFFVFLHFSFEGHS